MTRTPILIIGLFLLFTWQTAAADTVYQTREDFLHEAFGAQLPNPQKLWLSGARKQGVRAILGHRDHPLRMRYWRRDGRTAWILEEIGKVKPITVGFVVAAGRIAAVRVLIYRESRRWEVRHPFFTEQFTGARLVAGNTLDRPVDGISGATLSVNALVRLARLALYLHGEAMAAGGK